MERSRARDWYCSNGPAGLHLDVLNIPLYDVAIELGYVEGCINSGWIVAIRALEQQIIEHAMLRLVGLQEKGVVKK